MTSTIHAHEKYHGSEKLSPKTTTHTKNWIKPRNIQPDAIPTKYDSGIIVDRTFPILHSKLLHQ